ncbi:universal stress protein [Natronorubrum thiooxidans]|uniref:Nucleotide-binding universal stress protein, UspA family n=1 Tax=Natronorubrum thiooxidans TaxID=308853 RepID=A0A1N7CG28_9EURY|nr:universal stress protein [Natronorubrum thiooxidans]SIR62556.1 Nucleotide-binding universal stress protein, UspA family [Natronorubrum thiooxidans]
MYRVLLPVDTNEARARAQVDAVLEIPATADEIHIDVVHVHDETTPDAEWAAGGFSESYTEEMAANVRESNRIPAAVEAVVDSLEAGDVEYVVHEAVGEPAETILELATEQDSDVIMLGNGDQSPVGKMLFGSIAQDVLLESNRPVTVVPLDDE